MANNDVSPGLLRKLQRAFDENLSADKTATQLSSKIIGGTATYKDAGRYAECVGTALKKAMNTHLGGDALPNGVMYWHIAEDVLEPMLKEEYGLVSYVAAQTQKGLNKAAGMGLNPVKVKYDKTVVGNILGMASNAEQYSDIAEKMGEIVITYARDIVDQTLKANVEFQGESGRPPMIVRTARADCCSWCADLEGTYEYPNVPADVYKHHDYCKCDLEYVAGDKRSYSKVWSNENYYGDEARERLKTLNL